jgi:hypothetical protein
MHKKLQVSDHVNLTEDIQKIMFSPVTQQSNTSETDVLVEAISSLEDKLGKEFTTEEIKVILETVVYLSEKIVKKGKEFAVTSKKGKVLGKHKTRQEALKQLGAVEASKTRRGK